MTQAQQQHNMSYVELDGDDLPAYCPNPAMPIWSSHPRIFIPLDHNNEGKCSYCGTVYRLKPGAVAKGH
ncbi:zinc-finger domain-containing protein [Noviherbaspirillum sp. Root189]|uniref:zinc-finger domain-containing protein n=1 Tax=Noviherbaspirillum sp. Root189 TaxID=1736487 RepID=UPI0007089263|nr:zinc-finger domain-containing protein [Noviherbaspirillum sp. Root189]KRB92816.1 hypothetical protein ASE07_14330 [Noviherbaspirillum sp. Root189]